MRPEADQIPGACKNWFTVQRWVDVSNAHYGVSSLGILAAAPGSPAPGILGSIIVSFVGAVILVAITRMLRRA